MIIFKRWIYSLLFTNDECALENNCGIAQLFSSNESKLLKIVQTLH